MRVPSLRARAPVEQIEHARWADAVCWTTWTGDSKFLSGLTTNSMAATNMTRFSAGSPPSITRWPPYHSTIANDTVPKSSEVGAESAPYICIFT